MAKAPPSRIALGKAVLEAQRTNALTLVPRFRAKELRHAANKIELIGDSHDGTSTVGRLDEIVCATGQRPDLAMLRELRVAVDPRLECVQGLSELVDPAVHSCYTAPPHGWRELRHSMEPNFYIVGMKSYGRTPTFLTITGYQQVHSVVAAMCGNIGEADTTSIDPMIALAEGSDFEARMSKGHLTTGIVTAGNGGVSALGPVRPHRTIEES